MSDALRPVAWQYTAESGNEHYTSIKARALQFDANPMPLYAAPPSTAEKCYVCGGNDGIRGKHGIYCERTIIEGRFPWKPSTAEIRAQALDRDLLIFRNARRLINKGMTNWYLYAQIFGTGSTTAVKRCSDMGIDPEGFQVQRTREKGNE